MQDNVFDGSAALYWILVGGVLAYAASYFARGWLAGHQRFALYGGLVLLESCSRFLFAVAAVVGLTHGEAAVALGMAAAPLRLAVRAFRSRWSRKDPSVDLEAVEQAEGGLTLRHGAVFAVSVLAVMLAEQTLVNGAVLAVDATATDAALAGVVFSVLLIARAPLQLFQAIQGTLLPHLATLQATAGARGVPQGDPDRRCSRSRRSRSRWRSGSSSSAPSRWACCSTWTTTTGAAASRSSRSAWAATWRRAP